MKRKSTKLDTIEAIASHVVRQGVRLDQLKSRVVGRGPNRYVEIEGVKARWTSLVTAYWDAVNGEEAKDLIG